MPPFDRYLPILLTAFLLASCASIGGGDGGDEGGNGGDSGVFDAGRSQSAEGGGSEITFLPDLGEGRFKTVGVTPFEPSGSEAGERLVSLREELSMLQTTLLRQDKQLFALRQDASHQSKQFDVLAEAMAERLKEGASPGDEELTSLWQRALAIQKAFGRSPGGLDEILSGAQVARTQASFMMDRAYLALASDDSNEEDANQAGLLSSDIAQVLETLERMIEEMKSDHAVLARKTAIARGRLGALQLAIAKGAYFGDTLFLLTGGEPQPSPIGGGASQVGQRQPLGVILFEHPDVDYEKELLELVRSALKRRPSAGFDLVAVRPEGTGELEAAKTAKENGEAVKRLLWTMGLPDERLTLSTASSPDAEVNEVHLYVR